MEHNTSQSPAPGSTTELCQGGSIEYKAFARVLYPKTGAAVVCVLANCTFEHTGFSIFFQSTPDGVALFQSMAPGHFEWLACACSAGWCNLFAVENPPAEFTVIDSFGLHQIPINPW